MWLRRWAVIAWICYEGRTLCFSVASMNTEKTNAAVSSSSMTETRVSKTHIHFVHTRRNTHTSLA